MLLVYELIREYSAKDDPLRCMIQMDIQKAYDSVDWSALEDILAELGFPNLFIEWIMIMAQTVSYRNKVNNVVTKSIQAKRGLRQGDPISLLLFVINMEYLHRSLQKMSRNYGFKFH